MPFLRCRISASRQHSGQIINEISNDFRTGDHKVMPVHFTACTLFTSGHLAVKQLSGDMLTEDDIRTKT